MDERIEPYSKLFCDKYNSFNQLSQEQNLKVFSYNRNYLKMLDDNLNPIQPVNDAILLISDFLRKLKGFKREELQEYLDVVCINNVRGNNKLDTANMLLEYISCSSFEFEKAFKYRKYCEKVKK